MYLKTLFAAEGEEGISVVEVPYLAQLMNKSPPIEYKDTLAMPGSDLYAHLIKGDMKKAEQTYQETEKRHRDLMARIDAQEKQNVRTQSERNQELPP